MKSIVISSLLIVSSMVGFTGTASAENLVEAAVDKSNGLVYQVDLDSRSEYNTESGWRHVKFLLSTEGDPKKHQAIAACAPYDVQSEYYEWDWKPNGGGYPEGTIAGDIARVACDQ